MVHIARHHSGSGDCMLNLQIVTFWLQSFVALLVFLFGLIVLLICFWEQLIVPIVLTVVLSVV